MKSLMIAVAALITATGAASLVATSASAEQRQECKGILRQDQNGLSIQIPPPEGLCEINRSQETKVLATCRPGRFCRVYGIVEDCKDLDECAEITCSIGSTQIGSR
jgi:hypothetical protein